MKTVLKILSIEDNPGDVRLIKEFLLEAKKIKFDLTNSETLSAAKKILIKEEFDIILLDLGLPDSKGIDTFNVVNKIIPNTPIIIITALHDEELALTAVKEGAQDYLLKANLNSELLIKTIIYAIERNQTEKIAKELSAIVENANEAIIGLTLDGNITSWNNAAESIYGYKPDEIIGKSLSTLLSQEHKNDLDRMLNMIKTGEKITQYETLSSRKNNETFNAALTISPIKDRMNKIIGASVILHDITQSKLNEQQLAIQYRVALALAESTNLGNAAHSILKTICEILQWQIGEIWAVDPSIDALRYVSSWFSKEQYRQLEEISRDIKFKRGEGLPGYVWQIKKPYWVSDLDKEPKAVRKKHFLEKNLRSCFGFPIIFQDEVLGTILFFSDYLRQPDINFKTLFTAIGNQIGTFIKRKRAESDLLYLAQHDILTGLANRAVLENRVNADIIEAKAHHTLLALLYLDLDNFKKINDTMGHEKGDILLRQVGSRIAQCVRSNDIVARFGGDEFTVLLKDVTGTKDIAIIAQKILDTIAMPYSVDQKEFYITASIGISMYPDDGHDTQTLLKNADMAMYYAKVKGRNTYQFCLPGMATLTQQKIILESELHRALNQNEFVLYYQPKVDIKSGKITGLEALIRWDRAGERIISPDQFIPLAEETNLITPIGDWVLRTACLQLKLWQQQGLPHLISIAVNISAHQFNPYLISILQSIFNDTNLDPKYFQLELTENVLMNVSAENLSTIKLLNNLGVQLSIDDFGTGYSSFAYLKNFKINVIKIDQSFIVGIPDDPDSVAIVQAIINMAHTLNIKTIAEGVEQQGQLDLLKKMGCDEYQGFLFSKPLPAEEIYKLIINNKK